MDSSFWLRSFGRLQVNGCRAPKCACPQALLFVWPVGRKVHYELRTVDAKRFPGSARNVDEARRFASTTLADQGLQRMRLVHDRPTEVPRG